MGKMYKDSGSREGKTISKLDIFPFPKGSVIILSVTLK
jgi:hypothetical protein